MKYHTRTLDKEEVIRTVLRRLLRYKVSFVVEPIKDDGMSQYDVRCLGDKSLKSEDRKPSLNMAIHYAGGEMEE